MASEETVSEVISTFKCAKDNDIEGFLSNKAVLFNHKGKSKTHFVLNQDASFLIGQLAKNDTYISSITGSLLLEYALSAISSAEEIVGGRVVYIECRDIPKVIRFYEENGFKVLRRDPDDGLIQMYCVIGK